MNARETLMGRVSAMVAGSQVTITPLVDCE